MSPPQDEEKDPSWDSYYAQDSQSDPKKPAADNPAGSLPGRDITHPEQAPGSDKASSKDLSWQASSANVNPHLAELMRKTKAVEKTLIDHLAVAQVVFRNVANKEKLFSERPAVPFEQIPQIDKYRKAAPCSSSWDKMSGDGCLKFCYQCKLMVYDFSGMEMTEAQQIISKREQKENSVLYKRKDGKFLTKDCPVGVTKRLTFRVLMAVPVLFVFAGIFFLISQSQNQPHEAPAAVTATETSSTPQTVNKANSKTTTTIIAPSGQAYSVTFRPSAASTMDANSLPAFKPASTRSGSPVQPE